MGAMSDDSGFVLNLIREPNYVLQSDAKHKNTSKLNEYLGKKLWQKI